MITAPFNFVPLNEEVFLPQWAEDVSHDIPFEDSHSGVIDITVTAKSPIFIRDHEEPEYFCHYGDKYYIPGSSFKGMIRNVLEILSFAKMRQEIFDDDTYAVRDLSSAKNFYMTKMQPDKISCGWLKKVDGKYIIEDCGIPGRISHKDIDKALNIDFASYFQSPKFNPKKEEQKTAQYKYNLLKTDNLSISVNGPFISKKNAKYDKRQFYNFDPGSNKYGTLVVTGQPTPRKNSGKMGDGKGFEFLFFEPQKELPIDKKVFEKFLFAYFDKRETNPKESPDWTYWKKKLQAGEKVPVFFQKNGGKVQHFGLSYLYKLPYTHSVKDGIPKSHFTTKPDLVQTIFGYVDTATNTALKGRVQFSHFQATKNIKELPPRTEILGTPRASYYPMYIRQHAKNLYKTYMDSDFQIAGRKRYPIHSAKTPVKTEDTGNANVGTTFRPLDEGVVFKGKLRYHNLKKAELGAILSALTFHNTPNTYHNIGFAKPLGYGKIELKLEGIDDITPYLKAFESEVTLQIPDWSTNATLTELLTMAYEQNNTKNSRLVYMTLQAFAKNKSGDKKDFLRPYTQLEGIKPVHPNNYIDKEDLERLKKLAEQKKAEQKEKEAQAKAQAEQEKRRQEALDTDNIQIMKNFIERYPDDEAIAQLKQKVDEIEQTQKANKYKEVEEKAQAAFQALQQKRGKKGFDKDKKNFIKKWSQGKNHKGSELVQKLVQDAEKLK